MPTVSLIVYGDYEPIAGKEIRLFHPDTGVQQVAVTLAAMGDSSTAFSADVDTTYSGVYPFEIWITGGSSPIGYGFAPLTGSTGVVHATATKDEAETALNNAVLDALDLMIENVGGWRLNSHAVSEAPTGGGGGLDAEGVRNAVGLASANLDSQFSGITSTLSTITSAVDSVATNVNTLLSRIGSFAGSSNNTVKGFLLAMISKTATVPSEVTGDYDSAAGSLERLGELLSSVDGKVSGTVATSTGAPEFVSGTTLTLIAGDAYGQSTFPKILIVDTSDSWAEFGANTPYLAISPSVGNSGAVDSDLIHKAVTETTSDGHVAVELELTTVESTIKNGNYFYHLYLADGSNNVRTLVQGKCVISRKYWPSVVPS